MATQLAGHRLGLLGNKLFRALPGYDLSSGLGTLDASKFVPALAHAADF
jgi:hypothetical protein